MKYSSTKFKSEYSALVNAKVRCSKEKCKAYPDYGGRGIKVCDEWQGKDGFQKFMEHIGPKPDPKLTIDRIDNDGHYEPGNVRWADRSTQQFNQRRYKGIETRRQLAKRLGIDESTIRWREKLGDTLEEATTIPYIPRKNRP